MALKSINIPAGAKNIIKTLAKKGYQAYLVGGCVRDLLLKKRPDEWDITTSAKPQEVARAFKKVIPTGIKYGTVLVILPDGKYEVTTFRSDEKYVDGRHPEKVRFTGDIHKDLFRRDFTINALAYDPLKRELIDDHSGQKDLKKKLIRAVGDPAERFSEDGLRSLRACRFAAKLGLKIEPKTFAAIVKTLKITKKVAAERVREEMLKMLTAKEPSIGLELMRKSGLLKLILPELTGCYGIKQPPQYHKYDVYWHSLRSCDAAPQKDPILRMAALLHDLGKPSCKVGYTFYNHDKAGAAMAENILKRLKFSHSDTARITNMISHHMFNYSSAWSDAAVRRFIRRVGGEKELNDLFALREADTKAMEREIESGYLSELKRRIKKIVRQANALHVADLKVDGKDVMRELDLPPGPKVGEVLDFLLERVLDHPGQNDRTILLKLIRRHG